MNTSTRLIVLNSTKTGERTLVVHALSPVYGRRSFITTVGKGGGMSLFLPLNILEATVAENPHSDLWRISGVTAVCPLNGIRSSVPKNTMTMFLSEVLYRTVHEGAYEDGLFEWCERSILTLDALEADYSNYHLRFLLELASALGFSPSFEDIAPFAGDHAQEVRDLMQLPFADSMLYPLKGHVRNEIADIILKYISHHTDSRIEVRSLKILRELFSS